MNAWTILPIVIAALFTGAAVYINAVEHPARMSLDDESAVSQWRPAYARGLVMQASLAILGGLAGIAAWAFTSDPIWLLGAALMLANWPWTLLFMGRTNRALKTAAAGAMSERVRERLRTWARLHAVRTALGAAAVLAFGWALLTTSA